MDKEKHDSAELPAFGDVNNYKHCESYSQLWIQHSLNFAAFHSLQHILSSVTFVSHGAETVWQSSSKTLSLCFEAFRYLILQHHRYT